MEMLPEIIAWLILAPLLFIVACAIFVLNALSQAGDYAMPKISNERLSYFLGLLAGLTILFPLSGRVGSVPAIAPTMIFPLVAVALLAFGRLRVNLVPLLILALAAAYSLIVLSAANVDQLTFFLSPNLWPQHSALYDEAKLFRFTLYGGIGVFATLLVTLSPDRRNLLDGAFSAAVIVASIAALRTLAQPELIATDYMTARNWMVNHGGFSENSYAMLFAIGAVASMRWRYGWVPASIFLFCAALLSRRGETLIIITAMIVLAIWARAYWRQWKAALKPLLVVCVAATLFGVFHNAHNIHYFSTLPHAAAKRLGIFETALAAAEQQPTPTPASPASSASTGTVSTSRERVEPQGKEATWLFGHGLGTFRTLDQTSDRKYPHNILIETYIETGIVSTALMAAILAIPLGLGLIALFSGSLKAPDVIALGILAALMLITFKSGDITSAGRLFFFAALAAWWSTYSTSSSPRC